MKAVSIFFFVYVYAWQFPAQAQFRNNDFRMAGNDSAVTYASDQYKSNSFLHHLLMGKNYRKAWEQPVTLPVFRLSATNFKVEELGGGMQTKSLKLEDKNGSKWALRTIDKDVSGALPPFLKKSFIKNFAQDHISAAMPYGSLVIGSLAGSAGITAARPRIYFVADDTALGQHRNLFANTVCMLEERDPRFATTENTEHVLRKVQASNRHVVNQLVLLRARLFDMLIADWDRHFDNWRWGSKDSGGITYYHVIPRDRDWAFYYGGGLVPKLVRLGMLRFLINFKAQPRYIKSLSTKAHTFDKTFLNEMTAEDWIHAIENMQKSIRDEDIQKAVENLPANIYRLDGETLIRRLKSRRDALKEPVMKYYRFLSRAVQVEGSNEEEIFSILPADKGFILRIERSSKTAGQELQKIYERRFFEGETYQVTINGLGGDDAFVIDDKVLSPIRLTLNGGTGNDSYRLHGKVSTTLHDYSAETSLITNKNGTKIKLHPF
jgi:hypothetical protein